MPKEYVINHFSRDSDKLEECFNALKQNTADADVYLNAYCYLAYRAREEKFEDVEFILNTFNFAYEKLDTIEDRHTQARWRSSVVTAYCYLYIKVKGADEYIITIAEKAIDEKIVKDWPRIMVNPAMLSLLCIAYYIRNGNPDKANACISKAFSIYKEAIANSEINSPHIAYTVIHELKETTHVIGACILLGSFSGFCLDYSALKNSLKHLRNLIKGVSSTNIPYETFYRVYPELEIKD